MLKGKELVELGRHVFEKFQKKQEIKDLGESLRD